MKPFSNALAMVPADTQPGSLMISPKLDVMDECITLLDSVLMKLVRWYLSCDSVITKHLLVEAIAENEHCAR